MNTRCAAVSGWRRRGEQHVATCGRLCPSFGLFSRLLFAVRSSFQSSCSAARPVADRAGRTVAAVPAAAALPPSDCPACRRGGVRGSLCVLLLDGRSETAPSWVAGAAGACCCYRSRSGMSQTALVRRRCASCRCGLPPFLPSSLRPSAPPSLAPSVPPPPTTASPVAPPLLQRCGHGRAGQTCDVHEDVSHMRGRRPVLLLDASARDHRDNARERERANKAGH